MFSKRARVALAAALVLLAGTALPGGEQKVEGDLKKLQGEWTATSPDGSELLYTFKGKVMTLKGPTRTYVITITLDEKAKPHKTIDMKIDKAPEDAKGKVSKGIYKFDGDDKFIMCFRPEDGRPDKFENVGFEQFVQELKRKKK
jgi:uncharacterized protein (TIGR03067 family)